MSKLYGLFLFCLLPAYPETLQIPGLKAPVDILRDKWGVPHIYAQNQDDLYFANGYINARDRLFQIDMWRRRGTGKLAEALGEKFVERDRMALLFRFRGDWNAEWRSYAPDTRAVLTAFTNGINAYIRSLNGKRPPEFEVAGYDPGLWIPEDCLARHGGMSIMRNGARELTRAQEAAAYGLDDLARYQPPEPPVPLLLPRNLDIHKISYDGIRDYLVWLTAEPLGGSNNWAVDGTRSVTGKPLLASDPHRDLALPSLRRTIHLSMPGWSAIGAHEPALPGIALGHNDEIAFGFTITGIDQEDVYIERVHPSDRNQYWHAGGWKGMTVEKAKVSIKNAQPREVELRYTVHGPVIFEDRVNKLAYALRTVASEPGAAGYLASLSVARAKNWTEFQSALARFRTPSENMVYADRAGNIGWQVAGLTPLRKGWNGMLPVPGSGEYEWSGFLPASELPGQLNPPKHWVATANNNILPPGYKHSLGHDFGEPFRIQRIEEMLNEKPKFSVADFERMQLDVTSVMARRFQNVLRKWKVSLPGIGGKALAEVIKWDARMTKDSSAPLIYRVWLSKLPLAMFPDNELARRAKVEVILAQMERAPDWKAVRTAFDNTIQELSFALGPDISRWTWSKASWVEFKHPLKKAEWSRGRVAQDGDATTVRAFANSNGASYRQVIDLADWDRSTAMNAPGESGDPSSPFYSNLLGDWATGRYHPLPFTRKAVEAATVERIRLVPGK
jgi:penicillin G amidase